MDQCLLNFQRNVSRTNENRVEGWEGNLLTRLVSRKTNGFSWFLSISLDCNTFILKMSNEQIRNVIITLMSRIYQRNKWNTSLNIIPNKQITRVFMNGSGINFPLLRFTARGIWSSNQNRTVLMKNEDQSF